MSPVSISLPCALVKGKTTEHSESSGNCQPALETHIEREVHCLALLPHKRQDLGSGFWLPDCPAVVSGHTDTCPAQPVVALCSQPWQRAQVLILVQEVGEGGGVEPECLSPGCPSPFLGSQHLPLPIQGLEAIVPRL